MHLASLVWTWQLECYHKSAWVLGFCTGQRRAWRRFSFISGGSEHPCRAWGQSILLETVRWFELLQVWLTNRVSCMPCCFQYVYPFLADCIECWLNSRPPFCLHSCASDRCPRCLWHSHLQSWSSVYLSRTIGTRKNDVHSDLLGPWASSRLIQPFVPIEIHWL